MKDKQAQNLDYWRGEGLNLFVKLSSWIVMPILLAVWAGKRLDLKFNTEPKIFFATVGIAFIISIAGMIATAMKAMRETEKNNLKNEKIKK